MFCKCCKLCSYRSVLANYQVSGLFPLAREAGLLNFVLPSSLLDRAASSKATYALLSCSFAIPQSPTLALYALGASTLYSGNHCLTHFLDLRHPRCILTHSVSPMFHILSQRCVYVHTAHTHISFVLQIHVTHTCSHRCLTHTCSQANADMHTLYHLFLRSDSFVRSVYTHFVLHVIHTHTHSQRSLTHTHT